MKGKAGLDCLVAEAKGRGFTGIETMGGTVALDKWIPYGLAVLPRIEFATWYILCRDIHEGGPVEAGSVKGLWELVR